ncbi:MAG TPA: hypothetical protein DCM14_03560, partial [Clostridiales bacterium UBA8153]|nr:hypothetical protein [Clostridiales bacterium UBA8153]
IEAVRLVKDSGRPVSRIAAELGVRHETLRRWVRQGAIDAGQREGLIGEERERKTGVCSVASCRNLVWVCGAMLPYRPGNSLGSLRPWHGSPFPESSPG